MWNGLTVIANPRETKPEYGEKVNGLRPPSHTRTRLGGLGLSSTLKSWEAAPIIDAGGRRKSTSGVA
jgi:hypothetical protein